MVFWVWCENVTGMHRVQTSTPVANISPYLCNEMVYPKHIYILCKITPSRHPLQKDRQTTRDCTVISHMQPNPFGLGKITADRAHSVMPVLNHPPPPCLTTLSVAFSWVWGDWWCTCIKETDNKAPQLAWDHHEAVLRRSWCKLSLHFEVCSWTNFLNIRSCQKGSYQLGRHTPPSSF